MICVVLGLNVTLSTIVPSNIMKKEMQITIDVVNNNPFLINVVMIVKRY
jgi:ABC-type amino acid transport system permease subunit